MRGTNPNMINVVGEIYELSNPKKKKKRVRPNELCRREKSIPPKVDGAKLRFLT